MKTDRTPTLAQAVKERDSARTHADEIRLVAKEQRYLAETAQAEIRTLRNTAVEQAEEIARLKREIKNLLYGGRGDG